MPLQEMQAIQTSHVVIQSGQDAAYSAYRSNMPFTMALGTTERTKRLKFAHATFYAQQQITLANNPNMEAG